MRIWRMTRPGVIGPWQVIICLADTMIAPFVGNWGQPNSVAIRSALQEEPMRVKAVMCTLPIFLASCFDNPAFVRCHGSA